MLQNSSILLVFVFLTIGCSYTIKIKDGNTAYEQKQFDTAIPFLKKEFKKAKRRTEKGKIAFQLGESYSKKGAADQAIDWYKTAYNNNYGVEALREWANGLKKIEQYDAAVEQFENLGFEIGSPYEVRKDIASCKIANDWKKLKTIEYAVSETGFNSSSSDYSPVYYKNQLAFTSDRAAAIGDEKYKWTGKNFMDLFLLNENGNARSFSSVLNSEHNDGAITFNSDFKECYFTRCSGDVNNVSYCKILYSTFDGSEWSTPTQVDFQAENVNYMHPALSKDDEQLFFASNHPDGWGGYDIYVSDRTPDGWEVPRILSRNINTVGNEVFPTINGDTVYFSSDFHTGMGGLDIFQTYKLNEKTWAPPINMLPPLNSGSDDFGFIINKSFVPTKEKLQSGYFSSSRPGGKGLDDIYLFEKIVPETPPVVITEDTVEVVHNMILEGYVLEKIYQNPSDPNSKVIGRKPINKANVESIFGSNKLKFETDVDGLFTIELAPETTYSFFGSKSGYLTKKENFSTVGIGKDPKNPTQKFEIEIVLDKIFKDREITLENIYYDFNESFIREDAKPTLNVLANAMLLNPSITIQLSSHTDCRGNDRYNQNLSQKRAQAAVDYLIQNGIDPIRLVAKGYGEIAPAINCNCNRCSESEHQANRRTTFKILEQ